MEDLLETFQAIDPTEYISKFTSSNTRPSSRPHHTTRKTTLLPTILPRNTYGSSLTTIGSTQIITGITLQIGTPSPAQKTHGEVDVSLSFSPLCGGQYTTSGRIQSVEGDTISRGVASTLSGISYSDPQSIESWIKRTIVNSNIVDLRQLCVREGHSAWKVNIHCMVVNHDGNVVDGCILGIMTALKDLRLPLVTVVSEGTNDDEDVVKILPSHNNDDNDDDNDDDRSKRYDINVTEREGSMLTLEEIAVPLTVSLFQGKLLVDPTLEEENVSDGMITIVVDLNSITVDEKTNALDGKILSISKSGGGARVSAEEIAACVQLAFGRAKELESILKQG